MLQSKVHLLWAGLLLLLQDKRRSKLVCIRAGRVGKVSKSLRGDVVTVHLHTCQIAGFDVKTMRYMSRILFR